MLVIKCIVWVGSTAVMSTNLSFHLYPHLLVWSYLQFIWHYLFRSVSLLELCFLNYIFQLYQARPVQCLWSFYMLLSNQQHYAVFIFVPGVARYLLFYFCCVLIFNQQHNVFFTFIFIICNENLICGSQDGPSSWVVVYGAM